MRIFICILLALVVGGCAAKSHDTLRREQFEQLPHKYSQYDLKLAWDSKITGNAVIVEGVVWNVRWAHAQGMEIWVSLLDPNGRVLAEEVDLIRPDPLNIGEKSNFAVKLTAKPVPGSKLLFTYKYGALEDVEGSTLWMQSFEADL
ncbi:MAG: hypothetical protein WCP33_08435 [Deltaproteobacteria bacterium]